MFKKLLLLMLIITPAVFAQNVNDDYAKQLDSLRQSGTAFIAAGIETCCRLNIYSNGEIKMKINDNEFDFLSSSVDFDSEGSSAIYKGTENGNQVSVKITRVNYYNEVRNEYKYSTHASLNGEEYDLCGRYLNFLSNPFIPESAQRLYDIWAVKTFNGKPVPIQSMIEINLNDETMLGYNTMLELSSDIKINGDKISFYNIKFISGDESYFNELKEIDGKEFSFELKGLNFILSYGRQLTLGLVKAD